MGYQRKNHYHDKVFLATISPAAATVTQMALIFNQNANKASAIYGVTTLLRDHHAAYYRFILWW